MGGGERASAATDIEARQGRRRNSRRAPPSPRAQDQRRKNEAERLEELRLQEAAAAHIQKMVQRRRLQTRKEQSSTALPSGQTAPESKGFFSSLFEGVLSA